MCINKKINIFILDKFNIYCVKLNFTKYIAIESNIKGYKLFKIPEKTKISISKNTISITLIDIIPFNKFIHKEFDLFYKNLIQYSKNRIYGKFLRLKGLGYRVLFNSNNLNKTELRLGYSHKIFLDINKEFYRIKIKKNKILIGSSDPIEVGNFATKIKKLRNMNIFTGKGFYYKREKILLKEFKK